MVDHSGDLAHGTVSLSSSGTPINFPQHWLSVDADRAERVTARDLGLLLLALLGTKMSLFLGINQVFPKNDFSEGLKIQKLYTSIAKWLEL